MITEDIKGFWSIYKVIAGISMPVVIGLNIMGYHYSIVRVVQNASAEMQNAPEEMLYTVEGYGKDVRCVPTTSDNGVSASECEALALKAMRKR